MDQSPYRWCGEGEPGLCGGGLLRNEYGEWLAAFASRVGICTSVKAELLAVKHGLELAWSLGADYFRGGLPGGALDTW